MVSPGDRQGAEGARPIVDGTTLGVVSARFSDPYGATWGVTLNRNHYSIVGRGNSWRTASIVAGSRDVVDFRAAGLMSDGSVVARVELLGRTRRVGELRVDPGGGWTLKSTYVEAGATLHTQSSGNLNRRDGPVQLRRTRVAHDGTVSWTADAEMRYLVTGDTFRARRVTAGTVNFSTGGTGTFQTMIYTSGGTAMRAGNPFRQLPVPTGRRR